MKKLSLIVLSVSLLAIACKETERKNISETAPKVASEDGSCAKCDSIYRSFPKNVEDFDQLFGYPNGELYDGAEEIQQYFKCLDMCFKEVGLQEVINLGNELRFDADAPTHLQYHMTDFLMKNELEARTAYETLSCANFRRHISFLFESIHKHDSFHSDLCSFLASIKFTEKCKKETVLTHCR